MALKTARSVWSLGSATSVGKLLIVFDTGSHASKVGLLGSGGNSELMILVFLHPKLCDYWHVPPWFMNCWGVNIVHACEASTLPTEL